MVDEMERLLRWTLVSDEESCWIWLGAKNTNGYGHMLISQKDVTAHRLSYRLHVGPIPDGKFVCHTCDNRECVNPYHLYLGTNVDNMKDMVERGRANRPKGATNGRARLSEPQVLAIRDLRTQGWLYKDIAAHFGVHTTTVALISRRETWKHI